MQTSEEFVRLSIANGLIPGAMKVGRAYWVTDYQIQRVIEGRINDERENKGISNSDRNGVL